MARQMNNITQVGKDAWFRTINVKYGSSPRLVREMHLLAPNTVKRSSYFWLLALLFAPYEKAAKIRLLDGVPLKLMSEVLMFVQHFFRPCIRLSRRL